MDIWEKLEVKVKGERERFIILAFYLTRKVGCA